MSDFIAIDISNSGSGGAKTYYCNLCNCNLSVIDDKTGEFWCGRCSVSYFPEKEKVKRKSVFETPGPLINDKGEIIGDKMPLVSIVQDDKELSSTYGREKLPASFKEMERHGVKITSYTTTEDR